MPAILSVGDEDSWLDTGLGKKDIAGLLRAFPAEKMDANVISNDFLKKKADDPTILDKVSWK